MNQILVFILIALAIAAAVYVLVKNKNSRKGYYLQRARQSIEHRRQESLEKILKLFDKQREISNRDVQNLLSVSDATATNYLEELERKGFISQKGVTGRGVSYVKING